MQEVYLKNSEYNCKNCGGILHFDPNSQGLKCKDCSSLFPIKKERSFARHPVVYDAEIDKKRDAWITENKIFKCNNCGASIVANKFEISQRCPYCGTNLSISVDTMPGLKPDAIIPFKFDKNTAGQKFVENVRRKFYVSGTFKRKLPDSNIYGTYIPSFVFDMDTQSSYTGTLSRTTGTGDDRTVENLPISGTLNKKYVDVLVESSDHLTQHQINGILPYDLDMAVNYQNKYILGYTVEYYADTLKICENIAKESIDKLIRRDILSKYSYDSVVELHVDSKYSNKMYNYTLVPVYKFEYNYKNKPYTTYMNGQTGKVDNNLPKSIPKIVMTVILIMLIILLPIILSMLNNS